MSVGIVVVSHSRALAEGAVDLATQMVTTTQPRLAVASGTADGGLGTDAMAIQAAIEQVDEGDGVLVMVDLGSAVMSAEMALEFCDPDLAERVVVSSAPLVEGLVAAVVRAAQDAPLAQVVRDAEQALDAKKKHLDRVFTRQN